VAETSLYLRVQRQFMMTNARICFISKRGPALRLSTGVGGTCKLQEMRLVNVGARAAGQLDGQCFRVQSGETRKGAKARFRRLTGYVWDGLQEILCSLV